MNDLTQQHTPIYHGVLRYIFVGKWIYSFLTNRLQTVIVNGRPSSPCKVISGVPQGSVLGPLLFLILIGDIDKDVACSFTSSFADDTRVGKGVSDFLECDELQDDTGGACACREPMEARYWDDDVYLLVLYAV